MIAHLSSRFAHKRTSETCLSAFNWRSFALISLSRKRHCRYRRRSGPSKEGEEKTIPLHRAFRKATSITACVIVHRRSMPSGVENEGGIKHCRVPRIREQETRALQVVSGSPFRPSVGRSARRRELTSEFAINWNTPTRHQPSFFLPPDDSRATSSWSTKNGPREGVLSSHLSQSADKRATVRGLRERKKERERKRELVRPWWHSCSSWIHQRVVGSLVVRMISRRRSRLSARVRFAGKLAKGPRTRKRGLAPAEVGREADNGLDNVRRIESERPSRPAVVRPTSEVRRTDASKDEAHVGRNVPVAIS